MTKPTLLQELSEAFGVSGRENRVRQFLIQTLKEKVDGYRVDTMGNLIVTRRASGGNASPLKVMIAAHMDEIGVMVIHIEKNGLLRFRTVGGVDPRLLVAKVVYLGDKAVPGVIGIKPIHLTQPEERGKVIPVDQLAIDIGAKDRDEAESLIKVGEYGVFATPFGPVGRLVKGKAFDDRVGCAVLSELVQERYPVELLGVFTVQEEVGLRGARVSAYALAPDLAFALEGTVADDLPKKRDVSSTTELGKGPAITLRDRSFIADRRLVCLLTEVAERDGIPYQFKQPLIGSTDAGAIHRTRSGVPAVTVAVPCRYIHGPAALMDPTDFENTVRLMKAALHELPARWH